MRRLGARHLLSGRVLGALGVLCCIPALGATAPPEIPEGPVTLPAAVDFALRNNPTTRAAWLRAKAAEEQVGVKKGAYWPSLTVDVAASRSQVTAQGGAVTSRLSSWGPSAVLSWLVLDLGGRSGDVGEASALAAAAAQIDDAITQSLIFRVTQAYVGYAGARELAAAAEVTLREAQTNLEAAEARHAAGLATIADVLSAKTARSQADLSLEIARGVVETTRGGLATVLGVPATIPVDTAPLPARVALEAKGEPIEALVEKALASRPDLSAVRQQAEAARQKVRSITSSGLPFLTAQATAGRPFFLDSPYASFGDNWSLGVNLRIPVFSGFSWTHQVAKAKDEADAAAADVETAQQQVVLDVYTALQSMRTARGRLRASHDLLESGEQAAEAALARYKAGVGSLVDLLVAEAALAGGRAQDIGARASALLSIAELARATGTLAPKAPVPEPTR